MATNVFQVFSATAGFWSTVSKALDDTELTNPDILELMSECDIQVQRTMQNIVLPDLLAPVSEEYVLFVNVQQCPYMFLRFHFFTVKWYKHVLTQDLKF